MRSPSDMQSKRCLILSDGQVVRTVLNLFPGNRISSGCYPFLLPVETFPDCSESTTESPRCP